MVILTNCSHFSKIKNYIKRIRSEKGMFGISFKYNLTDLNFTNRDIIGFRFEVLIGKLLDRHGWKYRSNPLKNIREWKQYQRKGVDFDLVDFDIELESKSGYAKVFKSWILRDWIPRFSYHNETRIVIVKPTLKLSNQCLELLFNYGINVLYPDSISYLLKRGNKVLELNFSKNISASVDVENRQGENKEAKTEKQNQRVANGSTFKIKFKRLISFIDKGLNLSFFKLKQGRVSYGCSQRMSV
jgi:hypothetical protein